MAYHITAIYTSKMIPIVFASLKEARKFARKHDFDDRWHKIEDASGAERHPIEPAAEAHRQPSSQLWYFPYRELISFREGRMMALYTEEEPWYPVDKETPEMLENGGYQEVSLDFLLTTALMIHETYRPLLIRELV